MKITSPYQPSDATRTQGPRAVGTDWVRDWVANKGQFVRLDCKHFADLKCNGTLVGYRFGAGVKKSRLVLCVTCGEHSAVMRAATVFEVLGWPKIPPIPEEPPF